jgi:hypothetical protein
MAEKAVDSPLASVFDNPEACTAGDRRRALAAGVELPDRVTGAALFPLFLLAALPQSG